MSIARRGRVIRKNLRDVLADNNRWDRFYALMGGTTPKNQVAIKAKRVVAPRVADGTYESDIQIDIIAMLRKHSKVRLVERHNSGTAVEMGADGKKRYVRYSQIFKVGDTRMRKADLDCTLTNGKRFVIEVKRPPWKGPTDQRELEQENYINYVRASTGYGLFATSVQDVLDALDAIAI